MAYTVDEIARLIQGEVIGDGTVLIRGVSSIEEAQEGNLVLAEVPAYFKRAEASPASCILTREGAGPSRKSLILVPNPKAAFARILWLYHPPKKVPAGVHPSAVIGEGVELGVQVAIGPFVAIGNGVRVGDRVVIGSGCVIGDGCMIGEDSFFHGRVTLYDGTRVGKRVIVHGGAVVGAEGFGFVFEAGKQAKIPQVGIVVVEDDVEIGANVCIDRATLGRTLIGRGVKIDNLVQIGHNVTVGEGSMLSAQVGIGGSTTVGKGCTLAGQVGIADHVTVGDRVIIGAQSGVAPGKQLRDGQIVWGSPARPIQKSKQQFAAMARLPDLLDEVATLRRRVADLEARSAR
ncbi:MAG: UDP-3-O-(3-hydroxymyristoyl)glucosamine N-acyltransferase [candidate division NC10 bacterium]